MRIGILGAGNMAAALAPHWVRAGHDVLIGARSMERAEATAKAAGARAGTLAEAAEHGTVVLAALWYDGMLDVVRPLADALAGKTVIDCCNAIVPAAGGPMLVTDGGPSAALRIADAAPGAHVVKAFNLSADSVWRSPPAGLAVPYCGDDPGALDAVRVLITDVGCEPLPAGGLDRAAYLEGTAAFAIGVWFSGGEPGTAFPSPDA